MRSKCTDCGIYEAISGDELCEECREGADKPTPNPLISAIERVIAELELDQKIATIRIDEEMSDLSVGYWTAINDKCEEFINRLKEVLNTADNNPRNSPEPERDGQQEQSE